MKRFWQSLDEMPPCLLLKLKLPKMWKYAVSTAVYIENRLNSWKNSKNLQHCVLVYFCVQYKEAWYQKSSILCDELILRHMYIETDPIEEENISEKVVPDETEQKLCFCPRSRNRSPF